MTDHGGFTPAPAGATMPATLSRVAARALTDEVKVDALALAEKMLWLYEGGAHLALGYSSWSAYVTAEFHELSKSHAYRMLKAARVDRALAESPTGERPRNEAVRRELAPALDGGPERVREAWAQAVQEHGPEPTAAQVRGVVVGAAGDAENAGNAPGVTVCASCGTVLAADPVPGVREDVDPDVLEAERLEREHADLFYPEDDDDGD